MAYFDCPNGHIVLGTNFCTLCTPVPQRWHDDSYIKYHTDLSEAQGLLRSVDISPLQQSLLVAFKTREAERLESDRQVQFEQDFMLLDREGYRHWKAQKEAQERLHEEAIEWQTPTSLEEAFELSKIIQQMNQAIEQGSPEVEIIDTFPEESFQGIDLTQIRDE